MDRQVFSDLAGVCAGSNFALQSVLASRATSRRVAMVSKQK